MDDEEVLKWGKTIGVAALGVSRDDPNVERGDLEQHMWVELLTQQSKGKLLDPDGAHVLSAMFYVARDYARSQRKEHLALTSQYLYRTSDVRKLLTEFFDKHTWCDVQTPPDAYSELGNVGMEMMSDLSRAWDRLSRSQQVLIFQKFAIGEKPDTKKVSAAITRMAEILNTYQPSKRDSIGSRRVQSNASTYESIQEMFYGDKR